MDFFDLFENIVFEVASEVTIEMIAELSMHFQAMSL
jgi:hypothetical protein